MESKNRPAAPSKLDRVLTEARRHQREREMTYREQTVHHKDHNHDNNPPDGSNWELLCLYCHDNEHQRYLEADLNPVSSQRDVPTATYNPFAGLEDLLKKKDKSAG